MHPQINIPFKFEIPVKCFYKAGEKGKERRIGGIISTESRDRHGEIVLQDGLDFSGFVENGWINDNHSKDTAGVIGYPYKLKKTTHRGRPAHYMEGYLLQNYEPADRIWKLANALQDTGRQLGFSVEGGVQHRVDDGSTIAKAKVRNVAVTNCPVNNDTGLEILAKSLQAVQQMGSMDPEEWMQRALMAGQAITNPGVAAGQGFALRTESLERDLKYPKKISKKAAIKFMQKRYRGLKKSDAERILNLAARHVAAI